MRRSTAGAAFLLGLLVSGCGSLLRAPVTEEELSTWFGLKRYSYVATAPERRVVIFQYLHDKPDKVCAEPSADAADQIASALSAALQSGKDLEGKFSYEMATTVKQLFRRTQVLQLYRDRSFYLCMLWMNGVINEANYLSRDQETFAAIEKLMPHELEHFYKHPPVYDPALGPTIIKAMEKEREAKERAAKEKAAKDEAKDKEAKKKGK